MVIWEQPDQGSSCIFPYVQNKSEVHLDIIYTICSRCESRHHFQDKILTGLGLIFYESVKFNIIGV